MLQPFNQERPALIVLIPLQNPAVDSSGRVHCRSLDEWNHMVPGKASLPTAVQDALSILMHGNQLGYPSAAHAMAPSSGRSDTAQHQGSFLIPPSPSNPQSKRSQINSPMTQIDLEALSTKELEILLTDDDALYELKVKWLKRTQAAQALEEMQRQNVSLAQENLSMQGDIEEARNHVAIVRSSEYAAVKGRFDDLYQRHQSVLAKLSPEVVITQIQQKVDQLDSVSAATEDAFLTAKLPIEEFVNQYVQQRVDYHRLETMRQAVAPPG
ncbi:hypothetical protein CEUSTIGMA_g13651.t1 [Chlamydomonas eustigma]|uniref:VPS37 C-terminal domain-containing protein n=1 Tax=Chlamydomonas eustigma TaxID=1157962 RepID=A0A250XT53_9CHLO|nr:hypothetical protein CEUSTIGMA_g13651.t1 [Chlamydomonas eustigma]|eukprot:GAX86238.1 hypothetical protein CEUSTIGMA_g13651.t1 [Chlamydomonas eustigma]